MKLCGTVIGPFEAAIGPFEAAIGPFGTEIRATWRFVPVYYLI